MAFQPPPNSQGMYNYSYQNVGEVSTRPPEKESSTLLIRHLPEAIPHDTLTRLFSHYGASCVRPCTTGRMKNCAFVDFSNEGLATQAHCQLHGLRFLGKVLSVERANTTPHDTKTEKDKPTLGNNAMSSGDDANVAKDLKQESMKNSLSALEPIAEKLGVEYPFPPHLEYAYPPPDGNILTNILNALIAVPRFYTQVLHLMNKMNIPAPFRAALPTPPLPPPPPSPPVDTNSSIAHLSSGESELESSDEENVGGQRKRIKREAIVGPAIDKDVAHENVGLKPATLVPKEIPLIKKKNPVLQIKITPKQTQTEQVGDDERAEDAAEEQENENLNTKLFASVEDLENGKLPPEEILSLPMFKNYNAGNPAPVLYIKNLAKDVVADDFYFVFGTFFGSIEKAKTSLFVKLMQEGRMRGQAFVTFPSIDIALRALNLVNGFVFKGKPMIIQFGRNTSTAGKTIEK